MRVDDQVHRYNTSHRLRLMERCFVIKIFWLVLVMYPHKSWHFSFLSWWPFLLIWVLFLSLNTNHGLCKISVNPLFSPKKNYAVSESSLAICQLIITKLFAKNFVMKFENNKEIHSKIMRFRWLKTDDQAHTIAWVLQASLN